MVLLFTGELLVTPHRFMDVAVVVRPDDADAQELDCVYDDHGDIVYSFAPLAEYVEDFILADELRT
jgi:hypothetical protein